jgi:phage protein D
MAFQLLPDVYVPTFAMSVDNVPLNTLVAKSILEISVTEHLNPPSQFSFSLNDPKLDFIKKEGGLFTEGKRVEISLGFVGNTRRMMVGRISALTASFPSSGPATLQVEGFDLVHSLTRGTIYRTFGGPDPNSGIPDSQIVTEIAGEASLTPSVDTTPARTAPRVQNNKTNFAFLEELARENSFYFWVSGDTLNFKREPPRAQTIALERGKTLISFSPRLSTTGQVNAVEVRGWDPIQKQPISARVQRSGAAAAALAPSGQQQVAKGTGGLSERVIQEPHVRTTAEAQTIAENTLNELTQSLISGNGTSAGPPDLAVGSILELSGIGRFNGSYVVEQVTHSVGGSGYQTSFQVKARL